MKWVDKQIFKKWTKTDILFWTYPGRFIISSWSALEMDQELRETLLCPCGDTETQSLRDMAAFHKAIYIFVFTNRPTRSQKLT